MKILIVHNDYGKYSGEEAVVDKMAAMFAEHGHDVAFYRTTTAEARENWRGKIRGFFPGFTLLPELKACARLYAARSPM